MNAKNYANKRSRRKVTEALPQTHFTKPAKSKKFFPAWIQIRSTRMKIAELMAELVQRQRYAFMCQDEQNNASVRAKENMVTWTITHTRIDT